MDLFRQETKNIKKLTLRRFFFLFFISSQKISQNSAIFRVLQLPKGSFPMSNSQKFFNVAGPVIPGEHYMLPLRLDYKKVHELIVRKYFFILHAPRQTGKTSAIFQFIERLLQENEYLPLYVNVEPAQASRSNVKAGIDTILDLIKFRILDTYGSHEPALALFEKNY